MKRTWIISLVLVACLLTATVGGTIAWFTDSVESASNKIESGNLDIEVQYKTPKMNDWADLTPETEVFDKNALWEPGHTQAVALKVINKGNLAVKYEAGVNIISETEGTNVYGETFKLSDSLDVYCGAVQQSGVVGDVFMDLILSSREKALSEGTDVCEADFGVMIEGGNLLPGDGHVFPLVITMPTTVGNEANHKTGTEAPSIEFAVNLLATQYTYESDSFDNTYDQGATYPEIGVVNIYSAADFANVKEGNIINICNAIDLGNAVTLPANTVLRGNGHQINGTISAGGDLTIEGHVKVTSFSASYYNRTITIGEDACLEITGTGRMTLGYGNTFNITGTLENAKTADKTTVQPSLIIPSGISITGGNDAAMNVTNAYVQLGNTSSKNSAANGTFTLNFTNSIAEFTNQLTLSEPTGGMNPTFNINIKDSVLTAGTKFIVAVPNSNVVIDHSTVALETYFRNSGNVTLKNGSVLTGSTIQFGENGGNDGTTIVDGSSFTIKAGSVGHAFDGKDTGKLVLQNGATGDVDYYKDLTVECDATSTFTGTEVQ